MPSEQGSPHIVKTGRLDFSLSWLKGEVRENLGDFRKLIQIWTFLSPLLHVPLPFTKMNVLHYDLKKDAINEFGIKYWTSNPVWVTFQEHGSSFYVNIEEKVWLLVKKIRTWRKDWQGDWNSAFWQKLSDFIETKAKKSPTLPGLVSPAIWSRPQRPFIRFGFPLLICIHIWSCFMRNLFFVFILNVLYTNDSQTHFSDHLY